MKEGVGGGEAVHYIHPSFYKPVIVNPTCSRQKSIEIKIWRVILQISKEINKKCITQKEQIIVILDIF